MAFRGLQNPKWCIHFMLNWSLSSDNTVFRDSNRFIIHKNLAVSQGLGKGGRDAGRKVTVCQLEGSLLAEVRSGWKDLRFMMTEPTCTPDLPAIHLCPCPWREPSASCQDGTGTQSSCVNERTHFSLLTGCLCG